MSNYTLEQLRILCDENGIEYHHKSKEAKLIEQLAEAKVDGFKVDNSKIDVKTKGETEGIVRAWRQMKDSLSTMPADTHQQKEHLRKMYLDKANPIKKQLQELGADHELLQILRFEYSRKLIPLQHEYKLNEMESNACTEECECYRLPKSSGMFLEVGKVYKYRKTWDEARECYMYTTFVTRTVSREEQISKELGWKMSQGFMPEEKDYKPEYIQYKRFPLRESEWVKYLRPTEQEAQVML